MKLRLFEYETHRYKSKGLMNSLTAVFLLIALHGGIYLIGQKFWNTNVESSNMPLTQKEYFYLVGVVQFTQQLFSSALRYALDIEVQSGARKCWLNQLKPWHWERQSWPKLFKNTLMTLIKVHFIYFPCGVLIGLIQIKVNFQFPTFWQHILHLLFCLVMEDTLFYWTHRLLHMYPLFYNKIHKQHHEYDAPFANAAQYTHPLQYILGNMLPAASGILLLGSKFHAFTYIVFIFIRVLNTQQTHSGIDIPWSPMRILPFASSPSFHNFHHSKNIGTYGSLFYLWDFFTNTGEHYFNTVMQKQKIQK